MVGLEAAPVPADAEAELGPDVLCCNSGTCELRYVVSFASFGLSPQYLVL